MGYSVTCHVSREPPVTRHVNREPPVTNCPRYPRWRHFATGGPGLGRASSSTPCPPHWRTRVDPSRSVPGAPSGDTLRRMGPDPGRPHRRTSVDPSQNVPDTPGGDTLRRMGPRPGGPRRRTRVDPSQNVPGAPGGDALRRMGPGLPAPDSPPPTVDPASDSAPPANPPQPVTNCAQRPPRRPFSTDACRVKRAGTAPCHPPSVDSIK
ncbi:hypothetical protein ABIB54_002314 [Frigoribacterium sp. UYMn621]